MPLFSYHGRVGRLKFFLAGLIIGGISSLIGFLVIWLIPDIVANLAQNQTSEGASFLAIAIPLFFAGSIGILLGSSFIVRRFHDLGKSGMWWFALLIPFYNIHLAIGLLTERGTIGPNQYGEDTLPLLDVAQTDPVHRISQNKAARSVLFVIMLGLLIFSHGGTPGSAVNEAMNKTVSEGNATVVNLDGKLISNFPQELILDKAAIVASSNYDGSFTNTYSANFYSDLSTTTLEQMYSSYFLQNGYAAPQVIHSVESTINGGHSSLTVINTKNGTYRQVQIFIFNAADAVQNPLKPTSFTVMVTPQQTLIPPEALGSSAAPTANPSISSGWKEITLNSASPAVCYKVSYPSDLTAGAGTAGTTPVENFVNADRTKEISVSAESNSFATLDGAVQPIIDQLKAGGVTPEVKSFTTVSGLQGRTLVYSGGSNTVVLGIVATSASGKNILLEMSQSHVSPSDVATAETMAASFALCGN